MKKKWISVKRGFIRDPKHRAAVGEAVWLYLYMLDVADWDTGIIKDWKDEATADEMGVPVRTLREWRRRLAEHGYITCAQKQYAQEIAVHNWTNPREYGGQVYNRRQGDIPVSPEVRQGDTQGDTQGSTKDVTPTFNPNNQIPTMGGLSEKELSQANAKVTAIIESARKITYANRDKIPEPYLAYADTYNRLTGQEPTKRVISDWLMTFSEWQSEGLSPTHVEDAYKHATRPDGGFLVARPASLTNTAVAMKSKGHMQAAVRPPVFRAEEHPDPVYVPPPAEVRARLSAFAKSKSVEAK